MSAGGTCRALQTMTNILNSGYLTWKAKKDRFCISKYQFLFQFFLLFLTMITIVVDWDFQCWKCEENAQRHRRIVFWEGSISELLSNLPNDFLPTRKRKGRDGLMMALFLSTFTDSVLAFSASAKLNFTLHFGTLEPFKFKYEFQWCYFFFIFTFLELKNT